MIRWLIHMGMLGICSVEDWKEKKISLWKIKLYGSLILIYELWCLTEKNGNLYAWFGRTLAGLIPGIVLLIISRLSGETIGFGDGYLILIVGFSMGFWSTIGVLGTAFAGAFAAAIYVVLIKKRSRMTQIAFVPFLFLGMAGMGLWAGK